MFQQAAKRRVFIRGLDLHKVNNDAHCTLESMAAKTVSNALLDAQMARKEIGCVVVGNMLSPILQKQSQLASLVCQAADLELKDSMTLDAACGSGGSALRAGVMAILSGLHDNVLVVGIEQMKHPSRSELTSALAQASDWKLEGSQGATFVSLNDLLHTLYVERYGQNVNPDDFFYFSQNAHSNAMTSAHALLAGKPLNLDAYLSSKRLGDNVRLMDACPTANGCAALVLSSQGVRGEHPVVLGSDCRTELLSISKRKDPLVLRGVQESVNTVFAQAGITAQQVDVFEAHDAYSIMSALSLESTFVAPGEALRFAKSGAIKLDGQLPMSTFGGLKARGHPVGASGVYQIGELCLQLRGQAGKNQVKHAKIGLTSSFGGAATTVITHAIGL